MTAAQASLNIKNEARFPATIMRYTQVHYSLSLAPPS